MSESNVDASVIKKTQDTLGKYVKKPPLSDKLLKRPPFRFLHDIVNVIVKDTGYLKGLYSDSELVSDNIKDRDAKIKFLQSLIDVVKLSTGESLAAKPSKIVAGQEPDKTNELLQAIARAVENKVDSTEAVDTVKNGGKPKAKSNGVVKPAAGDKNASTSKLDNKAKRIVNETSKSKKIETTGKSITQNGVAKVKEKSEKPPSIKSKVEPKSTKPSTINSNSKILADKNVENKLRTKEKLLVRKSSSNEIVPKELTKPELIEDQIDNALGPSIPDEPVQPMPSPVRAIPTVPIIDVHEEVNATQEPLTPKSNSLEPPKTFRSSTDELSAIIDEEAERRRNEKVEKPSKTPDTASNSSRPNTSDKNDSLSDFEKEEKRLENDLAKKSEIDQPPPPPMQAVVAAPRNGIKKPTKAVHGVENTTVPNNKKSYIREPVDEQKANARPRTSLRPPSVRPASARPGAPRRRDKNVEIVLQPDELVKLGEINVKVETFNAELEDDGENLIVIEDVADATNDLMFKTLGEKAAENAQGHLVQQILDTQKEFSSVAMQNSAADEGYLSTEVSSQRQASAKQINALRDALQKLTRAVNPLGKLFDFLQEDIDAMEREFDTWKDNYKQTKVLINREKGLTENAIEPMKHQLAQIELNIKEHVEMINLSRANILQNEQKIFKLLTDI